MLPRIQWKVAGRPGLAGTSLRRRLEYGSERARATRHGEARRWAHRTPGEVRSTMTRAGAALLGSGHGGAMVGGDELSGSTEPVVRG